MKNRLLYQLFQGICVLNNPIKSNLAVFWRGGAPQKTFKSDLINLFFCKLLNKENITSGFSKRIFFFNFDGISKLLKIIDKTITI